MKYSLSPREIPKAEPERFPKGSGYISQYIPTRVTIQKFSFCNVDIAIAVELIASVEAV